MSYGIAEIKNRPVVFTSTFLGKNPLTRQTRRTFNRSSANMNGPIRNTFLVFCWNQSETILLQGSPELLICLLYMRRRALGRDCFWTGCPEIKRCEDSKRTLKNQFASRLAELDTTPKLLRITDQWYIVPVEFRLWRNRDFLELPYCRWPEDQKTGSPLMPIEGFLFLLPASIQAQIIVKGIRRNETAAIETIRKKPLRHGSDWGDFVELSFVKQNVLQRRVGKLLSEPPCGRQNQVDRRYLFRKTSAMKS